MHGPHFIDTDYGAPCELHQLDLTQALPEGVTDPGMVVVYDDEPDTFVAVPADFARFVPISTRLEYLRGEIRAERISYGELAELQSLVAHIDPGDTELLQWAGVPEYAEERVYKITETAEYGVRASSEAEALELFLENPSGYLSVVTDRTVALSEED